MYSWWWVELSPETCRVKPLRRINAIVASCWIYFTHKERHQLLVSTVLNINSQHNAMPNANGEGWRRSLQRRVSNALVHWRPILNGVVWHRGMYRAGNTWPTELLKTYCSINGVTDRQFLIHTVTPDASLHLWYTTTARAVYWRVSLLTYSTTSYLRTYLWTIIPYLNCTVL